MLNKNTDPEPGGFRITNFLTLGSERKSTGLKQADKFMFECFFFFF